MPHEKWVVVGLLLLHQTATPKQMLFPCLRVGGMAGKSWGTMY